MLWELEPQKPGSPWQHLPRQRGNESPWLLSPSQPPSVPPLAWKAADVEAWARQSSESNPLWYRAQCSIWLARIKMDKISSQKLSPWGREESDMTERLHFHFSLSCIGEGNGNPLQYSCLENPRDGGTWWAAVYGVAQSRTWLKRLSSSSGRGKLNICNKEEI